MGLIHHCLPSPRHHAGPIDIKAIDAEHFTHGFAQQFRFGISDTSAIPTSSAWSEKYSRVAPSAPAAARCKTHADRPLRWTYRSAERHAPGIRTPVHVDDDPAKATPALHADHVRTIPFAQLQVIRALANVGEPGRIARRRARPARQYSLIRSRKVRRFQPSLRLSCFSPFRAEASQQHIHHTHQQNRPAQAG